MSIKRGVYKRITSKDNHEYICPYDVTESDTPLSIDQMDDCVEAEVVGRYIGNLQIIGSD